jgi:hypothetical protein
MRKFQFFESIIEKIGLITNWIITLQILSLCLSQVNMEFCIKCGCEVVTGRYKDFLELNTIKFVWQY